jgi:hypothetical protein
VSRLRDKSVDFGFLRDQEIKKADALMECLFTNHRLESVHNEIRSSRVLVQYGAEPHH